MTGVTMMPWPPAGEPTASLKGCKPDSVAVGHSTEFTITGVGFTADSKVAFALRADPSQIVHATTVAFHDESTLVATATLIHEGDHDVFVQTGAEHAKGDNFVTASWGGLV